MKSKAELIQEYAEFILNLLSEKTSNELRTFGIEYEFISDSPLDLDQMEALYKLLPETGFKREEDSYTHQDGIYITFEPGGQIEYHSPPLLPHDTESFDHFLHTIEKTNQIIKSSLDIHYLAKGFIPDRGNAPLCLTSERYKKLHARLAESGTRGHEMMQGTASIHLHSRIKNTDEIPGLFSKLCKLSIDNVFPVSPDRNDIWANTDPTRCGLPYQFGEKIKNPVDTIKELVKTGLNAYDLFEKMPYIETRQKSTEKFMYHMTTIFTDVRLNIKGPTFELRTLDSMPLNDFRPYWKKFVSMFEE